MQLRHSNRPAPSHRKRLLRAAFAVRAAATGGRTAEAIRSEAERLANERGQLDALQPPAVGGHGKALGQREQQEAAEAAEAMKAAAAQAAMTVQAVAKTLEAAEVAVRIGEEPGGVQGGRREERGRTYAVLVVTAAFAARSRVCIGA